MKTLGVLRDLVFGNIKIESTHSVGINTTHEQYPIFELLNEFMGALRNDEYYYHNGTLVNVEQQITGEYWEIMDNSMNTGEDGLLWVGDVIEVESIVLPIVNHKMELNKMCLVETKDSGTLVRIFAGVDIQTGQMKFSALNPNFDMMVIPISELSRMAIIKRIASRKRNLMQPEFTNA